MGSEIHQAFRIGYERLAAWADLIDRINVFPVADGDTGRNLVISLAPLHHMEQKNRVDVITDLLMSSRGMSGNIATRFFSEFLKAEDADGLLEAALSGRKQAWHAVEDPRSGTILSVLDALCEVLDGKGGRGDKKWHTRIIDALERSVLSTVDKISVLEDAGVVDAGALGIYLFFEGFFASLAGSPRKYRSVARVFGDKLALNKDYNPTTDRGYCIDVVLEGIDAPGEAARNIRSLGGSVVTLSHGKFLKAHLHTEDRERFQKELNRMGSVLQIASDDLGLQTETFQKDDIPQAIRIVTDAAASVTREEAGREGITLLDSYINLEGRSIPESRLDPDQLYRVMRQGVRVSTSQASTFERHQQYEKLAGLFPQALYLCVGSIYTGNYDIARAWKKAYDPEDRLILLDSGLASGKLGVVVLATARVSARTESPEQVIGFAKNALSLTQEYVFLDRLQYLAAGGRISKTSSFFGDLLHMKPVITPTPEGAEKVTVLRSREDQLKFLLDQMKDILRRQTVTHFLLEYTDTRPFVEQTVWPKLRELCPDADFRIRPISNTSGAHMGPGTWGVAFLPQIGR